jgi:lysyl-tRNA synthetase class 2
MEEKEVEKKLQELHASGINPYPSGTSDPYFPISSLLLFQILSVEELKAMEKEGEFQVYGRVRFKNEIGSIGFARINDGRGSVQVYISKKDVHYHWFEHWKAIGIGDWISVKGFLWRTRTGELTLKVRELSLISKCISPLPDKHNGLSDVETRYRMRYLDMIYNENNFETLKTRSKIVKAIRSILDSSSFTEVETPILQQIPGGASAKPFVTKYNAFDDSFYLRIAPELYLKKLLVGGFNAVYEIGKNFRNEGRSPKHNPEFTVVEFYKANENWVSFSNLTQDIVLACATAAGKKNLITFKGMEIPIHPDCWESFSMNYLVELRTGIADAWNQYLIDSYLEKKYDKERWFGLSIGQKIEFLFNEEVEHTLITPTFVTKHPIEISPLARRDDFDSRVSDRFELYIGGMEIANGFSELNNPIEQRKRFELQSKAKALGDDEAMYFDEDFIQALEYGMPPAAGAGIGIDRLVMLLTDSESIKDVILFPTMKKLI